MPLRPEHIVNLQGKNFPIWAGVLDMAHEAKLKSLQVTLIQIPSADNANTAIVSARAEFEDGRVFEDLGDASPANTSSRMVSAIIRLASTRAKGRVLRDAVNVGETMAEEIGPDPEPEPARGSIRIASTPDGSGPPPRPATRTPNRNALGADPADPFEKIPAMHVPTPKGDEVCADCGKALTKNDLTASAANAVHLADQLYCMTHISERRKAPIR